MAHNNAKRYFQFLLIVLAAGAIFPVIYLKTNYQETMLVVFNMTLEQLNTIYSVLGIVFLVGYFPSGLLSDKFSAKKLLALSLFGTGVGGLWFAQVPDYTSIIIIFCIWGIFSVFTFWSAHMKLVKLLAKPEEEGRFFGILDGGRGVVEALLASVAVFIFSMVLSGSDALGDKRDALVAVIYMYSIILIVVSVLVAIFVEEDKTQVKVESKTVTEKNKFNLSDLKDIFKNKFIFLLGGIIFMSYSVTWTVYYFGGFLETNIGVDSVSVGTIMVIVLWMRPIGGIIGGFLADKIGKETVLRIVLSGAAIALVLISILPPTSAKMIFYIIIIITGIFIYAIRGVYWSLLGDCNIDNKILGAAIGIVSVMGYLPDIILPVFNSNLFKTFGDNGGYNAYFISSAILGVIGVILVSIFAYHLKKERNK